MCNCVSCYCCRETNQKILDVTAEFWKGPVVEWCIFTVALATTSSYTIVFILSHHWKCSVLMYWFYHILDYSDDIIISSFDNIKENVLSCHSHRLLIFLCGSNRKENHIWRSFTSTTHIPIYLSHGGSPCNLYKFIYYSAQNRSAI